MLCKCLAGTVGGEGRVGGGAVIVVTWGFWKCLLGGCTQLLGLGIPVVVVVLSLLGRGGWNGFVCMNPWRPEGFPPNPHILLPPPSGGDAEH